jgi:type I restriction enzyme R subunit
LAGLEIPGEKAYRNILVDQTMANGFKHFGDKMTEIKNWKVDKS